ncbi:hypothetical protein O3P69_017711 [Scylla paramamosain]|uniref:Protein sleepless n=1 Tax=Scylla paramamosain TaxID=85552 RepID=A0AAW0U1Q0_SCYPA
MAQTTPKKCLLLGVIFVSLLAATEGFVKRCYSCRSRGRLGDCKDPVSFNGWCSKVIEGKKDGEDHDLATERQCLQRSPPDDKERCSEALIGVKKVFICFCRGDLCNPATIAAPSLLLLLPAALLLLLASRSDP